MVNVDAYTRAAMKFVLELNGIYLMPPAVPASIQRFCRPLTFYNQGYDQDISFSGSCLLFRYRGRNMLLCSRHQLVNANRQADEIVLVVDDESGRRVGINPNEVSQAILDPLSDAALTDVADVMIAEYSTTSGRDISRHFLALDLDAMPDLRSVPSSSVDGIFSIGYPSIDTSYETSFDKDWNVVGVDVVSRWWKLYFKQTQRNAWDTPGLIPLDAARAGDPLPDDPDGFSGAPVFFLYGIDDRKVGLGFAGMVIRANKLGRVNMIEAAHIRQILGHHLDGQG